MQGLSDSIAAHVAGLASQDVPPPAIHAAKLALLDAVGVMLGASGLAEEARPFVALARAGGSGPCAILGTGLTAPPEAAALANGAFAHALDFEDAFDRAPGHPNASLVPALIALAQSEGPISGLDFLAALAIGGDLSCRMGLALRRRMEAGHWYPPPILAAYGAAAGAARLIGLDPRGIRDALSLTLCQATMPGEIKHSETSEIRAVREAFPARAAVTSALLARGGVRGFEEPLEGKSGFYALYAGGQYDPADLLDGLGNKFLIEELTFKAWPCCRGTHAAVELALRLRAEHGFASSEIERIEIGVDEVQQMLVEPAERKRMPATSADAKFSIPFTCAVALARGRVGLDDFGPATLADPEVLRLCAVTEHRIASDPCWVRGTGGSLTVVLYDGRRFAATLAQARGAPGNPLSEDEIRAKFVACAGYASVPLSEDAAQELADLILEMDRLQDAGAIFN